jgi:transcriptional regulator with PAS, ATPase and Fis domain
VFLPSGLQPRIREEAYSSAYLRGRQVRNYGEGYTLGKAIEETKATRGYIMLPGRKRGSSEEVRFHQWSGEPARPWDRRASVSSKLVATCYELGTVLTQVPFDKVMAGKLAYQLKSASIKLDNELHSAIAAPFVDEGGVTLGALVVYKHHAMFELAARAIVDRHAAGAAVAIATRMPRPAPLPVDATEHIPGLLGEAYAPAGAKLRAYAPKAPTLLVTGGPGTGKESVARAFHAWSGRKGPFVPVNVACLTEHLADSELFGHAAGSFTNATKTTPGLFEEANGGTLFFDELGEMPLRVQAKLLRALEERRVRRVGEFKDRKVDVRVVAATNRDLRQMIKVGEFRQDLHDRFKVAFVALPSLEEHLQDLTVMVPRLLQRISNEIDAKVGIAPACMKVLQGYHWPGNVRELYQTLMSAALLADARREPIGPGDLEIDRKEIVGEATDGAAEFKKWELLRAQALLKSGYKPRQVADILGHPNPRKLYRWIDKGMLVRPEGETGSEDSRSEDSLSESSASE